MHIITWLLVGLVAGALAAGIMRGSGFGVVADIVLGIAGAFVGGWSFHELGWRVPFSGVAGAITVALIGAVIILVGLRLLRRTMARR
jgi:uncharacterized membrane protein YeaQ/YmgE (transglycosylase-associated protein family)